MGNGFLDLAGTTRATVDQETGQVEIQVPNKKLARLIALGVHCEVAERKRALRRRAAKQARKRNRKNR